MQPSARLTSLGSRMPMGKSNNSESSVTGSHNNGRSSMRRLSSFASLQQLLPFSRSRRSTATNEDSFVSDASSTSTDSAIPLPCNTKPNTRALGEISHNIRPVPPHAYGGFLRKNAYVSVPDGRSGALPRSKTFSNLPVPVNSGKRQSQIQTPPDVLTEEPIHPPNNADVATPTASSRRSIPFSNLNNASSRPGNGSRLPRSDTEPLLIRKGKQRISIREMLKENMSVELSKHPLTPPIEVGTFASSFMTNRSSTSSYAKLEDQVYTLPRHPSISEALPKSSPVLKSKPARGIPELSTSKPRSRLPFVQRWNSQPNLLGVIDQSHTAGSGKNLSTRRLPTPPPSALPSFSERLTRSLIAEAPRRRPHLEKLDESEVLYERDQQTALRPQTIRHVVEAQPAAYWAGRLSTLLDRAKDQETSRFFADINEDFAERYESDKVYDNAISTARVRVAFESLYGSCTTSDARESFVVFQLQYAALHNEPELAKSVGRTKQLILKTPANKLGKASINNSTPSSSSRSAGFMNRLLGRNKRSSIAS